MTALFDAFNALRVDIEQLAEADWQHGDSLLQRIAAHLGPETELGRFSAKMLPSIEFATWYEAAKSSMGAVAGRGQLDWPGVPAERVALQSALVMHLAESQQGIRGFTYYFFSGNWPERQDKFVRQVVKPFYEDFVRIALPILKADHPESFPPGSGQVVYNFHAAVGAVQTGHGSTANVSQTISQASLNDLVTALRQVATDLTTSDVNAKTRAEVESVVSDAIREATLVSPNRPRLVGLAFGAANAIQTLGSLDPAYKVLKAALLAFGIQLP